MPDDHLQTISKLEKFFSDDEIYILLDIKDTSIANRYILDCLIQRMKSREEMLDFCDQLEKAIASEDLRTITKEIKEGMYTRITKNLTFKKRSRD